MIGDDNPNTLTFRAYTSEGIFNLDKKEDGMEIHVWCISEKG